MVNWTSTQENLSSGIAKVGRGLLGDATYQFGESYHCGYIQSDFCYAPQSA